MPRPADAADADDTVLLRSGPAEASVHPAAGGRLGQLTVAGRTFLRGPEHAHLGWGHWGCYPLLPWSNRIPGGRFAFEGRTLEVPVTWEDGSALHGLTAWEPWEVVTADEDSAEVVIEIAVGSYHVGGRQRFALTSTHLDLGLEVENLGAARVPAGLGIHPWFPVGPISVPAERHWPGEPMPTGPPVPVGEAEDLRTPRLAPPMDRCYTGLTADAVHPPGLRLSWSGPITQVVVFSGVPEWVCVEPVTMANDGFRLADEGVPGAGVVGLDPGERLAVTYRFEW